MILEKLGEIGNEFGTVTGRQRRCGWFDAILLRHSINVSGIDGIALTKLDVLDSFKEVKICIGYKLNGKNINYFHNLNLTKIILFLFMKHIKVARKNKRSKILD